MQFADSSPVCLCRGSPSSPRRRFPPSILSARGFIPLRGSRVFSALHSRRPPSPPRPENNNIAPSLLQRRRWIMQCAIGLWPFSWNGLDRKKELWSIWHRFRMIFRYCRGGAVGEMIIGSPDVIFWIHTPASNQARSMLRCIRDFWITERRDCCERRSHASLLLPVRIPRIVPLYYRPDLPALRMEEVQSFLADAAILRTPQLACMCCLGARGCRTAVNYEVDNSNIWASQWKSRETRAESLIRDNPCCLCQCPCNNTGNSLISREKVVRIHVS